MAGTPLICPHCRNQSFRVLRRPRTLECLACGRACTFDEAAHSGLAARPTEPEVPGGGLSLPRLAVAGEGRGRFLKFNDINEFLTMALLDSWARGWVLQMRGPDCR